MQTESKSRWRRLLRFSFRTMLVVVTALCVWLGIWVQRSHKQKQIVEELERCGATVHYDFQYGKSGRLQLSGQSRNEPAFAKLFGVDYFYDVRTVAFSGRTTIDDPEVKLLRELPHLKVVVFYNKLAEEDLTSLLELKGLENLLITQFDGNRPTIDKISKEHPNLTINVGGYAY